MMIKFLGMSKKIIISGILIMLAIMYFLANLFHEKLVCRLQTDIGNNEKCSLRTTMLKNYECCKDVYMLVLVGTHPDHSDVRRVIRYTWGNPSIPNFPFKLVFLLGQPTSQESQQHLEEEIIKYGDILQGDFIDSYHNITTRDLMGLKWASENCQQAHFIMRADDDIAFDIYYLIDVLEEHFVQLKDFVACFCITRKAPVERTGRYGISVEEYPNSTYPDFCHGWMYILTPSTAHKLVQKSLEIRPFWINDVYITGTLVEALGMQLQNLHMNFSLYISTSLDLLKDGRLPLPLKVLPTNAKSKVTKMLHYMYLKDALQRNLPHHKFPKQITSN